MKQSMNRSFVGRIAGVLLLGFTTVTARADLVYFSNGSDITGFTNEWDGVGYGGTVESASPFMISGVSQGSYIAATSYPMAFLSSPVTASAEGIWVGYLLRATAPNNWAGGINLSTDTYLKNRFSFGFAGAAGWFGNSMNIVLADPSYNASSGYTVVDGQSVAVLAHFYDTGSSGTFNTGDLYVDPNLADGISFGAPIVSDFAMNSAVSSIGALRLEADPSWPGETRYYDNIVIATTQAEALGFLQTGVASSSVPEPSSLALLLVGLTVCGGYAWRKKQAARVLGHRVKIELVAA